MAKYIDADALTQMIVNSVIKITGEVTPDGLSALVRRQNQILDMIDNMPAADVEPVRHGRWQPRKSMVKSGRYGIEYVCSNCQRYFLHFSEWRDTHHYCPNCGAKMDGGSEE